MNRDHLCRYCTKRTRQRLIAAERPGVEQWRCSKCGTTLLTYRTSAGVVEDAEGLCHFVLNEKLGTYRQNGADIVGAVGIAPRKTVAHRAANHDGTVRRDDRLDLEDALGYLRERLYIAWRDFDPDRGVAFRSYAVHTLRRRLIDWIRQQRSKDGRKPQANATALSDLPVNGNGDTDASRLEHALADGALDHPAHSLADLRRVLAQRRGQLSGFDPVRDRRARGEAAAL